MFIKKSSHWWFYDGPTTIHILFLIFFSFLIFQFCYPILTHIVYVFIWIQHSVSSSPLLVMLSFLFCNSTILVWIIPHRNITLNILLSPLGEIQHKVTKKKKKWSEIALHERGHSQIKICLWWSPSLFLVYCLNIYLKLRIFKDTHLKWYWQIIT